MRVGVLIASVGHKVDVFLSARDIRSQDLPVVTTIFKSNLAFELLDEVLADLGRHHRLVLITKGDLVHQTRKVSTSGLEHHFDRVGVVLEKDRETYRRLLADWTIDASQFVMVGNSVPSDVLPVLALGGRAVHIPYHVTWDHETVDASGHDFPTLDSIRELPGLIATWDT